MPALSVLTENRRSLDVLVQAEGGGRMSNFRFGADDYKLSYYPPEASNGIGGVAWDKVESVEVECDEFVQVVRCGDRRSRHGNRVQPIPCLLSILG